MKLQSNYINSVSVNSGTLFFYTPNFTTPGSVAFRDRQIKK